MPLILSTDYGDYPPGTVIRIGFATLTGALTITAFSTVNTPIVSVLQAGFSSAATAGVTLVQNFASTNGYHQVAIDTSADPNFYVPGAFYMAIVTQGFVASISAVGLQVGSFSLSNRTARANVIQWSSSNVSVPNIAGEPLVDVNHWRGTLPNLLATGRVDAVANAMGAGVIGATTFSSGAILTSTIASNAITAAVIDATFENGIADALLDRANAIETGVTPRQALRYVAAAEVGVTAGAQSGSFTIAAIGNAATNRITATTTASGNRSAITLA